MTGINQTILMSLSMVVIAAMIAAGGLGEIVLKGITQMKIGLGFEGGIAVVILAIILDRITQGFGKQKKASVVGAISSVKPESFKLPTSSLSASLAGRMSGVIAVQRSGEPGRGRGGFLDTGYRNKRG